MIQVPAQGATLNGKQPTVYDVARRAEVSIATVSRVLRGPQTVRESTRTRVLDAVRELGYVPSASARGLAGRRTKVLGLLFPGETQRVAESNTFDQPSSEITFVDDRRAVAPKSERHLYFDEILRGAEDAAWQEGYALMVAAGQRMSGDVALANISGRVDALAVVAKTIDDSVLAQARRRIPVVVLAGPTLPDTDSVRVDNTGGMHALATYVLKNKPPGPILYLDGPQSSPDAVARRAGFIAAAEGSEATFSTTDFTEPAGFSATSQFLAHTRPGAVIAANDQTALGALDALADAGVEVPGQCVVTGFDGIESGRYSSPTLTTVQQPMARIGQAAVGVLLRRLATPDAPILSVNLPVQIFLRSSCPPTS